MSEIRLRDVIAPHFYELHKEIKSGKFTEYVLKGGRGTTKSSFVSIEILLQIKRNPNVHALICRKVKDTLRDSVYSQIVWAIDTLGLSREFKCTRAPLEIVYKPTGQVIYFRGADDPYKIKSIKPVFGYIGILWFEELDQFAGQGEIRSIEQSVMRGGDVYYNFKSFNPPISALNWANEYARVPKPLSRVHHSTYKTVPPHWLGKSFFDEAEFLKSLNERAYRHEYLGEAIGTGGNVFENITARKIEAEELASFDRVRMGIDWGYFPDPFHWAKVHFDAARRTLYVLDEYRANKQSNRKTALVLTEEKGVLGSDLIVADSAEKKSVADYREYGLNCVAAKKGAGSVDYSMKWLQSLSEIVIDEARTPETFKEFSKYEYERSRDGEFISGYVDRDNHAIDAIRYATEPIWRRGGK